MKLKQIKWKVISTVYLTQTVIFIFTKGIIVHIKLSKSIGHFLSTVPSRYYTSYKHMLNTQ